jgi:hypothetical protein
MQLNPGISSLRLKLAAASCALLGTAAHAADAPHAEDLTVDTGILYYKEGEGRVQVVEPVVSVKKIFSENNSLDVKLTFDSLTGGSPNGAIPSKSPQTFSTTSGSVVPGGTPSNSASNSFTTPAGALPVDPNFTKKREGAVLNWSKGIDEANAFTLGLGYSHELDFKSTSISSTYSHDFNNKNTTLTAGVNVEYDKLSPVGGTPVPFSYNTDGATEDDQHKTETGELIGLTQIMSRRWIWQLNYSHDVAVGYLNDPYKLVSVVSPFLGGAVPVPSAGAGGKEIIFKNVHYIFEQRPGYRHKDSIYLENRYAFDRDSVAVSYRYSSDSWGIRSHTLDTHYHFDAGNKYYVEPHVRYYTQSAADFFRYYVLQNDDLPDNVSADYRLAHFNATTLGAKLGRRLSDGNDISLRIERYGQFAHGGTDNLPGVLQGLDIHPNLHAWIVQFGYGKSF